MDILNPRPLRERAEFVLRRGREPKKLVTAYACVIVGLSLLVTLADLWLEDQISGTSGLSNLGNRAIFSTAQVALPMVASFVSMCLELGYLGGMMRIVRGQYADHTDLKIGFRKLWPLVRMSLFQGAVYFTATLLAVQLGSTIFAMTPLADPMLEILTPLMESGTAAIDEATLNALMGTMGPMFIITGIVSLLLVIPILHRYRMANYCLLDEPNGRALVALRTSSRIMRRRFLSMLKIDLSLWPYYAATLVMTLIMYLDMILATLGIVIPMDARLLSLLVYCAALAVQFLIQFTLRNKVEATYLAAYEQLREKPKDNGVVLGNIFDM